MKSEDFARHLAYCRENEPGDPRLARRQLHRAVTATSKKPARSGQVRPPRLRVVLPRPTSRRPRGRRSRSCLDCLERRLQPRRQAASASASWDGTAKLWDAATGQVYPHIHDERSYLCRCVSPGRHPAGLGRQGPPVTLWDAATGQVVRTLAGHTAGYPRAGAFAGRQDPRLLQHRRNGQALGPGRRVGIKLSRIITRASSARSPSARATENSSPPPAAGNERSGSGTPLPGHSSRR